jgi:capsular polysaccharide biosynthesis protein
VRRGRLELAVRQRFMRLLGRDGAGLVPPVVPEATAEPGRVTRAAPLLDLAYYGQRLAMQGEPEPASGDLVTHYLLRGAMLRLSPNPLFDDAYYRAQLPASLPDGTTPLEHYLNEGAAIGLDPSPIFATRFYLRANPDVAAAGVNPLVHFLLWGVQETWRRPLPGDLPDIDQRISAVLDWDGENAHALRLLAHVHLRRQRYAEAAGALEEAERSGGVTLPAQILQAQALNALGQPAAAAALLMAAFPSACPTDKEAIALLLYSMGERKAGIELLGRAVGANGLGHFTDVDIRGVRSASARAGSLYREVRPARAIEPLTPCFVDPPARLTSEPGELTAPPVYFAVVEDCLAVTRCSLVLQGDTAIYDLAAHRFGLRAVLGDGFRQRVLLPARHGDWAVLEFPPDAPVELNAGLMMFGCQTRNYGHWFVEFLPRMLVFDSRDCDLDAPILVDRGMPATHLEALDLLNTARRTVVEMPEDRVVRIGRLGMSPVPAFFPCDTVDGATYDTIWPHDVFAAVRLRILEALSLPSGHTSGRGGRRLFISRGGFDQRQLVNEAEVAEVLAHHGFESVLPHRLSFAEQVRTFNGADVIVGSCSSALTNALFCQPGCRVLGLIHDEPSFNFRGYASFLRAGGVSIRFLQGRSLRDPLVHPLHAAYSITPAALLRGLAWAEADREA